MSSCDKMFSSRSQTGFISEVVLHMLALHAIYFSPGKGGSKIKELQMRSGCRIKVMSQESGPTETPVELTGNPNATRKAEEMIQDLTSAY